MSTDNIIEVPEIGLTSQLMDEIRAVIADHKYDHVTTSEVTGVLEMLKFEYMIRWSEH